MPEVNDEVMVAFEHGDFNRPVVLGGVWSKDKLKEPEETAAAAASERPLVRAWRSIKGHRIVMYDDNKKKIEVTTTGGHTIVLDDQNKKVEVKTSGGHTVAMDEVLLQFPEGVSMLGLMQNQQLLISSLIEFADRHHGEAEVVSRRVEGDIHLHHLDRRAVLLGQRLHLRCNGATRAAPSSPEVDHHRHGGVEHLPLKARLVVGCGHGCHVGSFR